MTDFQLFLERNLLKKKDVAEYLGVSSAFITQLTKGDRGIPNDKLAEIKQNKQWDTSMLNFPSESEVAELVATDEESYTIALKAGLHLVPEYNTAFYGGSNTPDEAEAVVAHWHIPNAPSDTIIVPMRGNSMIPRLMPGAKLLIRHIEFFTPMSISFGEIFAIAVREEYSNTPRTHVKILRRHTDKNKENTHWIARSVNREEYDDFEIEIAQVARLFSVVMDVNLNEII